MGGRALIVTLSGIHLVASILDSRPKSGCRFGYGPRLGCGAVELANLGLFSVPSLSSDRRGAATLNASTSFCSLDISSSFCLRTP
jgi:hypothetical protein